MDTITQTTDIAIAADTTTAADTRRNFTDAELEYIVSRIAPFACEFGGVTSRHGTFAHACKYVVDRLGPVHLVTRRDFGARRIGVWVEQYDVTREPDAVITWSKGARP